MVRPKPKIPVLGMILPAAGQGVAEAEAMYPAGVGFLSSVVGLQSMSQDGYDAVIDRIIPAARALARAGADAVMLMGTSLSFYRGPEFNARLRDDMAAAAGVPALTMSDAIVAGLNRHHARRVAAATAYSDEINARLSAYLAAEGFDVLATCGLGITSLGGGALDRVTVPDLVALADDAVQTADGAEAVLVSCGGLRTLDALQPIEDRVHLPVVSSFPHAVLAGMRLLGVDARMADHGSLLAAE